MSYEAAIAVVLAVALVAAGLTLVVQRRVSIHVRRHHHDVGSVVFLQLGVVFAVLLAFVFSETWSEYNEAAQAINLEVGDLHGVAMLAATLPAADAERILADEQAYLESVIYQEWPAMARTRDEDEQTDLRLQTLIQALAVSPVTGESQNQTKSQMQQLLAQAHTDRETRIFQASSGIPLALWVVLISISAMLAASVTFCGIEYRFTAAAVSAGFAAAIVSILVVARLFDYPFEGALALPPSDFADLLDKLSTLMAGITPPPG